MPRPNFRPTAEQRKLVRSLAALGVPQQQICVVVGLRSPKTLRKHFRPELFNGFAEAYAAVARTAYEMAVSGRYPAMSMFWDKCQSSCMPEAEMHLNERPQRRKDRGGGMIFVTKPRPKLAEKRDFDAAA
jgi:hypothetical protein